MDCVTALAIGGDALLSTSYDGTYKIWDVSQVRRAKGGRCPPSRVGRLGGSDARRVYGLCAAAADGALLVGDSAGRITRTEPTTAVLKAARGPIYDIAFSAVHSLLLGVSTVGLHLFPLAESDGDRAESAALESDRFVCATFIGAAKLAVGLKGDNSLRVFDFAKMAKLCEIADSRAISNANAQTNRIAFVESANLLYSIHEDGRFRAADTRIGAFVAERALSDFPLNDICVSGERVTIVGADNAVRSFDARSGESPFERFFAAKAFDFGLMCVAELRSAIFVGGSDGTIRLLRDF